MIETRTQWDEIGDQLQQIAIQLFNKKDNCYHVSEALYHLSNKNLRPMHMRHESASHWFLRDANNIVIDATVSQFKTLPDYTSAIGKGFLTVKPSKKTKIILERFKGNNII
jgi:hypothetical protein